MAHNHRHVLAFFTGQTFGITQKHGGIMQKLMHEGFAEEVNHDGWVCALFNLLDCFLRQFFSGLFRAVADAGDGGPGCTHLKPFFKSLHAH